jgi:hypothetical protein
MKLVAGGKATQRLIEGVGALAADQEGVRIPPRNQNEKGRDANTPPLLRFWLRGLATCFIWSSVGLPRSGSRSDFAAQS